MNELVNLNGTQIPIIEWKGQRVVTTEMLSTLYGSSETQIKQNFNNNVKHFNENEHFFLLKGEELKDFKNMVENFDLVGKNANQLYLWTRKGASRHCKMLGTDKAWEQFDALEENYYNPQKLIPTGSELIALAVVEAQRLISEKDKQIETMKSVIKEIEPKANYVDKILQSKSTVLVSQIANDYGMTARAFNKLLKNLHIQHKVGNQWILYSDHQGNGYVHSGTFEFERKDGSTDVNMNTEWTQKGRLFLYEELKKSGIVPDIEKGEEDV